MRLFSRKKIGKIKFILLGLGFFLVSFPVVSVYAVAPTITVGSENSFSTGDSPGLSNIFKITSPEENRILIGCPISTVDGLIGNTLKSIETITYTRFDSGIRELECPSARSDISSAPSNNNGILGVLNMATGSILEQRPASGIQFAEEKIYAITNPGKVYAQDPASYFPGTGFDLLQPIRSFWGWSVNLVFGILIVIILFVAFAIILGDKMPGNMKVTLQSAIPNIALAMILVPLSYSISGLFVDFITIGSNAVHDFVLGPASPGYSVYLERDQGPNDRGLYIDDERLTWINARSQVDVRQEVDAIADSGGINNNLLFQVVATILNVFANEEVSNVGTNPSSASAWLGTIINGILSILMIWIGIKILIRLFKKYLSLIIMPIFSPFIFATIAVPGNGTKPIVTYTKSLAASSLGFIVTYLMFLLTIVFSSTAFQSSIPDFRTGLWVPPLIGITQLEELTGAGAGLGIVPFILGLIAIGIYFSIPKVLDQIDDALGAKFSLPEFVRTPIESFRESTKMTFRGAGYIRTAPSRVRGVGAKTIDRILGYDVNKGVGAEARLRQSLGKRKLNIEKQMQEAIRVMNDPTSSLAQKTAAELKYQSLRPRLASVNSDISAAGTSASFYGEKDEKPSIEVKIDINGSPVAFMTDNEANTVAAFTIGKAIKFIPIKVKFYSKGFTFSKQIAPLISLYTPKKNDTGAGFTADELIRTGINPRSIPGDIPLGSRDPKNGELIFPFIDSTTKNMYMAAWVKEKSDKFEQFTSNTNPNEWVLPLELVVFDPAYVRANMSPGKALSSEEYIFKYLDYESDPVKITVIFKEL